MQKDKNERGVGEKNLVWKLNLRRTLKKKHTGRKVFSGGCLNGGDF